MLRHQDTFTRERRLTYFEGGGEHSVVPEVSSITQKTHGLLEGLKQTIVPSKLVETTVNTTVLTGLSALNIALLGGVFASGIYMIVAGKPPPFLRKITGGKS